MRSIIRPSPDAAASSLTDPPRDSETVARRGGRLYRAGDGEAQDRPPMAAARRVGSSLRCGVHGCDHPLGTIEHGPILRDGSEAVNLILARGFRPDADGNT